MADAVCGRLCGAGILLDTTFQSLIDFLEFDLCGGDRLADERHHEASVDLALDDLGVRIGVDRAEGEAVLAAEDDGQLAEQPQLGSGLCDGDPGPYREWPAAWQAILKTTRLPACICPAAWRMCGCHSG